MYLNNVTLTGFVGGDAETRTTKSKVNFTVFSLATKNSWKDRESGKWTSRTEWHRAVVFGQLANFARAQERRSRSDPGPTAEHPGGRLSPLLIKDFQTIRRIFDFGPIRPHYASLRVNCCAGFVIRGPECIL